MVIFFVSREEQGEISRPQHLTGGLFEIPRKRGVSRSMGRT